MTETRTARDPAGARGLAGTAGTTGTAEPEPAAPYIDHSVYPDRADGAALPDILDTDAEKADYMDRICAAWDYGVFPERETIDLFRTWKPLFDRYPFPQSAAYHTFRRLYGWEDIPFPKQGNPRTLPYEILDELEGREPDPCASLV